MDKVMNPELQKKNLENKIKDNSDLLDLTSLIDDSLNYSENLNAIKNSNPSLFETEINLPELLMLEAKSLEEEQQNNLKEEIKRIKDLPDVSSFYGTLKDKINMIKSGLANVLILRSNCGLGKTTQIKKELADVNPVIISGHYSPRRFYASLFENRDNKIIFMDDMEELLENKIILCMLKQGLDTAEKRTITWDSTIGKNDELPPSFNLTSRIILAINNIPKDRGFEAILDRSLKHEIKLSNREVIALMRKISPKVQIIDFIEANSDESISLNLRTLYHIERYYEYSKDKWKELALELLNKSRNKVLEELIKIEKENISVKEKIKLFSERTNLGRSSYFSAKQKMQ